MGSLAGTYPRCYLGTHLNVQLRICVPEIQADSVAKFDTRLLLLTLTISILLIEVLCFIIAELFVKKSLELYP